MTLIGTKAPATTTRTRVNFELLQKKIISGFSFTDTGYFSFTGQHGKRGTIFYSTLPLPNAHKHSDNYLQFCM